MKKMQTLGILSILSLIALFSSAHAAKNPYHLFCKPEGYLWTPGTGDSELPLCKIQQSAIGADDVFQFKTEGKKSLSILLFLSLVSPNDAEKSCLDNKGFVVKADDSDGLAWQVCKLPDNSLVDLQTLGRGSDAPENEVLKNLLLSR